MECGLSLLYASGENVGGPGYNNFHHFPCSTESTGELHLTKFGFKWEISNGFLYTLSIYHTKGFVGDAAFGNQENIAWFPPMWCLMALKSTPATFSVPTLQYDPSLGNMTTGLQFLLLDEKVSIFLATT